MSYNVNTDMNSRSLHRALAQKIISVKDTRERTKIYGQHNYARGL